MPIIANIEAVKVLPIASFPKIGPTVSERKTVILIFNFASKSFFNNDSFF
ncbi:MAG: hypothetical protein UR54_C0005G0004 [Candidatus Roizmanbacteria bacterium GW2011_GWA2_34_18]|uniref:Uncharacterized protein n=1 Tax=Candidatus Roizmanbacteria bacterium GW2011_GWA2_34_18 TaxID=1618477 RepID=A0A0G0E109_9BACT|nr:MAG: hypothetical protein UR54_C0005G0004 [Candidatus Roizmanbacteria bacterium GW2011_GWA2_34_18]